MRRSNLLGKAFAKTELAWGFNQAKESGGSNGLFHFPAMRWQTDVRSGFEPNEYRRKLFFPKNTERLYHPSIWCSGAAAMKMTTGAMGISLPRRESNAKHAMHCHKASLYHAQRENISSSRSVVHMATILMFTETLNRFSNKLLFLISKGVKLTVKTLSIKKIAATLIALSLIMSMSALTALAAGPFDESETVTNHYLLGNDTFSDAKLLTASLLLSKSYTYVQGNFIQYTDANGVLVTDPTDYYKFSENASAGLEGRFSIKLEGVPSGHNYSLFLYDINLNLVASSERASNVNEIVRQNQKLTAMTTFYIEVRPISVPNYSASNYRLVFDKSYEKVTKVQSLTPASLYAAADTWSSDAYYNNSSLPSTAVIRNAKVSASKGTSTNAYNNQIRVKIGSGAYETVAWANGDITVPGLVGQNANGYWYAGFRASELPTLVGGNAIYGGVSMKTFKITIEYEYDKDASY
jgi:hypothetical protein